MQNRNLRLKAGIPLMFAFLAAVLAPGFSTPLERLSVTVDGQAREALVAMPTLQGGTPAPVVFAFHGHGGSMEAAQRKFRLEELWPEAMVVYPQGLPTPGGIVDPAGKLPGWQLNSGDNDDRDIAFFDALLESLRAKRAIDDRRIYLLGHSNGAVFTYLLWARRAERIAAICPIAGIIPTKVDRSRLAPMPVFHVGSRNDPLVKIAWQYDSIDCVKRVNECDDSPATTAGMMRVYASRIGKPLQTYIDSGGHDVPKGVLPFVIDFFKENPQKR
jgi:polyhydroxybutyrate depolymerase